DARSHPDIPQSIVAATGYISILFQPVIRHGDPIAVLCLAWSDRKTNIDDRTAAVAAYLAAETGAAIERAALLARLHGLARSDELPGLPNRRGWQEAVARVQGQGRSFCLALIDLDHFKDYNDRFGHDAGDDLLRRLGGNWQAQLRPGDVLARYGGEEFAVLLR